MLEPEGREHAARTPPAFLSGAASDQDYACRVRRLDRADASRSALIVGLASVATLAVFFALKRLWPDLDCGDAHTVLLDVVITATGLLAAAAIVLAVVAATLRADIARPIAAILVGAVVLALILLPSASPPIRIQLAAYNCGVDVV